MIRTFLKVLLPLAVLAAAFFCAEAMIKARPKVEKQPPRVLPPLVRVVSVEKRDVRLKVESQGTVAPRTESQVVPEVSGRVTALSPSFTEGGFFEKGEVLLRIDPRDYEAAVVRAEAEVAQRKFALAREEAEAEVARKEWEEIGNGEPADPLTLRIPQLKQARALLAAAQAALDKAVETLPERQREVVLLRLQGLSFKEIARIQRTSLNTALGRMHYAVERLKRSIGRFTDARPDGNKP